MGKLQKHPVGIEPKTYPTPPPLPKKKKKKKNPPIPLLTDEKVPFELELIDKFCVTL